MKRKHVLYILCVALIVLFSLGPIVWCFIISISPEQEMLTAGGGVLPSRVLFTHYADIFDASSKAHQAVFGGLANSIKISLLTIALGVPISYLTAYGLARFDFPHKTLYVRLLLLTVVIPVFTTIIPVYNVFRELDLLDNIFWNCVIYISSFLPLNTWIMMNYIKELPEELWQAAAIDGFSEREIFTRIALPLSKPILLTTTLILFLMAWKQYMIPMILLSSYENKPLTMILSEFMTRYAIDYGTIAAVGVVSVLPPAIAAILFRNFLVSGLAAGAVKR
ncbi:multiple sugar transport system permease protein [Peptoniphilus ivorii]|uniref:carbohydrate ABC transporter permease n=1 Tax=Aedoeadaptatus ivorii TaxID=54006 RepID=UPI002782E277|nr:carbohydrate ABC transporter permease [Peptoniphilus ivorii]MDQ0508514.1 multiple sugar transport system permease protein [Peptoniphilus ivorii]